MLLNPITYHAPKTIPEAAQLQAALEDARILAGGTFLLNNLKQLKKKGLKTPKNIVSLKNIPELRGISANENQLTIKSMTVINDIFNSPLLKDNFSVLKTVCRNISTNPIRNMATLGGNLTSRYTWTELGAVLIALEANMHFIGAAGQETVVSVEDFFKNNARSPGILTHVAIKRTKNQTFAYQRVRKMSYVDVPLLAICLRTTFQGDRFSDTRVAVNNCVNFARRDSTLEEFLNKSLSKNGVAEESLHHLDMALYDTRADEYKKAVFRVHLREAVKELITRKGKQHGNLHHQ